MQVTFDIPSSITVQVGDTGKETLVDIKAIYETNPEVLRFAALNGFIGALNNVSRGKDDDTGAANSDEVWASMREKRARVWLTGSWAGRGGGGGEAKGEKEAYIAERLAAGSTLAKIDAAMKAQVISVFGAKATDAKAAAVPVTFDNFLRAVAVTAARREDAKAKIDGEAANAAYDKMKAHWQGKAAELRKARTAATADIDLGDMGL